MRKAINENPVFQVVLIGLLGIVVAFMFMTRVMGDGGAEEEPMPLSPEATAAATSAPAPASAGAESADAGQAAPAPAPDRLGFEPGPGLPKAVVDAYERGDAIALLVTETRGIEDKPLRRDVQALRGRSDVAVFTSSVRDVARYSRIARGVDLNRAPALVIIQPRRFNDGELPGATISYGYRGPESVRQALRDAFYDGKQLPFHPG